MKRFDQKQLLDAYYARELTPMWIEQITPINALVPPEMAIATNPDLKSLAGEWQTSEIAPRRFCLDFQAGVIRLQTSKLGFWTSRRTPILSVKGDVITFEEAEKSITMRFKLERGELTIQVPGPSVFQGEFKLSRKTDEQD